MTFLICASSGIFGRRFGLLPVPLSVIGGGTIGEFLMISGSGHFVALNSSGIVKYLAPPADNNSRYWSAASSIAGDKVLPFYVYHVR